MNSSLFHITQSLNKQAVNCSSQGQWRKMEDKTMTGWGVRTEYRKGRYHVSWIWTESRQLRCKHVTSRSLFTKELTWPKSSGTAKKCPVTVEWFEEVQRCDLSTWEDWYRYSSSNNHCSYCCSHSCIKNKSRFVLFVLIFLDNSLYCSGKACVN